MWTIIGIGLLALVAWAIIKSIAGKTQDSQVEYLLGLVAKSYQEGQPRKSIYNDLLEMAQEKKYSEQVINEVVIHLLYPLALQLINERQTNPEIREKLKAAGYDEFFIELAIEKARSNH